jgi:SAM-dependent methyltransferase
MTSSFRYDDIADAYASRVDAAPYNALYERPAMLALLPSVSGARVLDAGTGAGWYAAELARRGALVTGIDASAALIEHACARFAAAPASEVAGQVELKVADLEEPLSFASDSSYDGIVSSLVLHYLREWVPTMREFRRILKPNGWLLFSTNHPAAESIRNETNRYLDVELIDDYWEWIGTIRYYRRSLSAIIEALTEAGLAVEKLVEPLPTEEFRKMKSKSYERLLKQPEFLIIRARPWPLGR